MLPMGHLEAGTKSTVPIRSFLLCSFVIRSWWCSHLGVNVYSLLRHVRGTGFLMGLQFPHLVYEGAFSLPLSGMGSEWVIRSLLNIQDELHSHQCTIHWIVVMTKLWMNPTEMESGFT